MNRTYACLLAFVLGLAQAEALTVGVYRGPGADAADADRLEAALGGQGRTLVSVAGDDLAAELRAVDVLVVAGGSGTSLGKGLGAAGGEAIESFVRGGGGYVGLGAGAYLGARGYNAGTRNLELIDARLIDRSSWSDRGEAEVELEVLATPFGPLPATGWWFAKGALFGPARSHGRAAYTPCARFVTDLQAHVEDQAGIMPATHAVVCAGVGQGRAVLFSVLPHHRPSTFGALQRAVGWAAGEGEPVVTREDPPRGVVRVALLDDEGAIAGCVEAGFGCLDEWEGDAFWARRVSAAEIRAGVLKDYDVVVVSGGSATKQSRALEAVGQDALREFVGRGGGYVGVCAGAYLAATEPSHYGLGLAPVRCVDTKHWKRGTEVVELEATPDFAELSQRTEGRQRMLYANGPLLEPLDEGAELVPLLVFRSDVHENGAPSGVMPGKLAALLNDYRRGRVAVFSTHPELTPGFSGTLSRAVLWAAGK